MNEDKSSISQAKTYQKIGEFWDNHDLSEEWGQTEAAEFTVDVRSQKTYYPIDSTLSKKLHEVAQQRGVSAETLLNLWLQEKVTQEAV
jgi:hypothetical protein